MTNLNEVAKEYKDAAASATHALIIGQTKLGKSDWVAQAVKDGWEVMYIDHDNGLSTLLDQLTTEEERSRVHYFNPANLFEFVADFIAKPVLRYDSLTRRFCTSQTATPGAIISEIRPSKIPKQRVLVSLDSWTSLAMSVIQVKAEALSIDLLDSDRYGREIYGGTGFRLTQIAEAIQASPFHWIIQGHPNVYEMKEKPPNRTADNITEKDMIVKETWQVPMSTSGPHGYSIGKFFNQIGWLEVGIGDKIKLNFKVVKNRIGGGTPRDSKDPRVEYRFATLFGKPDFEAPVPEGMPWLVEMTTDEFKAAAAQKHANAPKLTTTGVKPAVLDTNFVVPVEFPALPPIATLESPAPSPSPDAPVERPKLNLAMLQGMKKK